MKFRLSNIGVVVVLALISSFLVPEDAMAAKAKGVNFDQYTFELVPGNSQSLRGVDALLTCADGSTVSGPLFDFAASRGGPSTSGSWQMIAAPGAAAGDGGNVDKVIISSRHFVLRGTWEDPLGRGNAVTCFDASIPADIVLEGTCGVGQTVILRASNGVSGTIKGDVTCNN
jgi:hypothetical protein